jgi:hypothetical protein
MSSKKSRAGMIIATQVLRLAATVCDHMSGWTSQRQVSLRFPSEEIPKAISLILDRNLLTLFMRYRILNSSSDLCLSNLGLLIQPDPDKSSIQKPAAH